MNALRRLPRVRLAGAALILDATLASAVILHGLRESPPPAQYLTSVNHLTQIPVAMSQIHPPPAASEVHSLGTVTILRLDLRRRPSWADPLALAICVLGSAEAAGVLVAGRRRTA